MRSSTTGMAAGSTRFWILFCAVFVSLATLPVNAQLDVAPPREDSARRRIQDLMVKVVASETVEPSRAAELFDAAWELAVREEDPLIDLKTETLGILAPGAHQVDAGSRAQLQRVYESTSTGFRRAYEEHVAAKASAAFAATGHDYPSELQRLVQRYRFTEQGQQVLQFIVQVHLSRGEYLQAALQFGRLLNLRNDTTPDSRVKLALMWWNAGLPEEAEQYLSEIVAERPSATVTVDGQVLQLPSEKQGLRVWLSRLADDRNRLATLQKSSAWSQPLGNYRRTQTQNTGPASLTPLWNVSSFECVWNPELDVLLKPAVGNIQRLASAHLDQNSAIAPTATPLVVDNLLIFRGAANIRAVDRTTGELIWESSFVDSHLQSARQAVFRSSESGRSNFGIVLSILRESFLNHLVRANTGGQLTRAGNVVLAVEEVTSETMETKWDTDVPRATRAVNYLRAYDVRSGQTVGVLGGTVGLAATDAAPNPLRGYYVLGAPLVIGERIYVMAENDQGIFLLQLLTSQFDQTRAPFSQQPVHSQLLSVPRHSLRDHPVRMYAGITPSFGRGLLICNTCDEKVIAVSAEDHSVRWAYRYPTNVAEPELNQDIAVIGNAASPDASDDFDLSIRWQDAIPRIVSDRILLTPRDSDRLICLDLQTGRQIWTRPRGRNRRLVAADAQRIVLTGTEHVECRSVENGDLLWQTEIDDGRICGKASYDGRIVQIPTSDPAIVSVEVITGRVLLTQPITGGRPGNLLALDGHLYSQSLTDVRCFTPARDEPPNAMQIAGEKLLAGDTTGAEAVLRSALNSPETKKDVADQCRELLVDTLLESLRMDFSSHKNDVAEIRKLIEDRTPRNDEILQLAAAMLNISPGNLEVLPEAWNSVDESYRQLEKLHVLNSQFQLKDTEEAAEIVAGKIVDMLNEAHATSSSLTRRGTLTQRTSRITAASIRRALNERDAKVAGSIREQVRPELLRRIQHSSSVEDARWWFDISLASGFVQAALEACADGIAQKNIDASRREFASFEAIHSLESSRGSAAMESLFNSWVTAERPSAVAEIIQRTQLRRKFSQQRLQDLSPDAVIGRNFVIPEATADDGVVERWQKKVAPQSRPWQGTPKVIESPARSAGPFPGANSNALQTRIPFYGPQGAFPNWFLAQKSGSDALHAFDGNGVEQWAFDPTKLLIGARRYGYRFNRLSTHYAVAYGNLLAIKLHHLVFVLDCSKATSKQPPELLWTLNIFQSLTMPSYSQQSDPAWQRTTQYHLQPAGLFPLGPISPLGMPVYSGRRLIMFDVVSGERQWQVDGLPEDCLMTATDSELILISESSGSVEVRSLIDGRVAVRTPLPEWWTDAAENSNSSIRDFEVEPGEQQRFRIALESGRCMILRRNNESSALEMFDLRSANLEWSIDLPQDSVVSNVVDGHIAILSDGQRLRILDLDSATQICDMDVPPAIGSRHVHLRPAAEQWLVLTDVFDQEHDFQNPVGAVTSVQVNGPIYAIAKATGQLTWTRNVEHRFLRVLHPTQGPFPPATPLLVLLKQPYRRDPNGVPRGATVQAAIYDTRTGEVLYEDTDLGYGLSYHRLAPDSKANTIEIAFDKRQIVFDYNAAAEN